MYVIILMLVIIVHKVFLQNTFFDYNLCSLIIGHRKVSMFPYSFESLCWNFYVCRLCSRCSFSMMVKWRNDGLLQANDGKMLVNDGKCSSMMVKWVYDHILISPSLTSILTSLTSISQIINEHLTIIRSFDHHWEAAPTALWFNPKNVFLGEFYSYKKRLP